MDRVTRSEGLGRAPFHGVFHTIISIIILGLSAYLYHHFKKGRHDYIPALRNVYLFDLIISVLAVGGGLLICLPVIGRPIVLAIALAIPLLYMAGFAWTEYEHHKIARFVVHKGVSTTLVVFLGIAAFLGLIAFIAELSMFRRRRSTTTTAPTTAKGPLV